MKAVFWWYYMHSPNPLKLSEIIEIMPTDQSIVAIYNKLRAEQAFTKNILGWGDALVWEELHRLAYFELYRC